MDRMRRRLGQFGNLVTTIVGKYNELSDGGHFLLDTMAASRMAYEEHSSSLHCRDREARMGVIQDGPGATSWLAVLRVSPL